MAPVVTALRRSGADLTISVCVTGQHREMLGHILQLFGITPDVDLNVMTTNQTLASLTSRALESLDAYFLAERPDLVLVQGDTTTAFSAALAAFYRQLPVGHVEAGLRTWNALSPFPEEANRTLISHVATLHFAPTASSRDNLLREGVSADRVTVTGNTVVDALRQALDSLEGASPEIPGFAAGAIESWGDAPMVLITGHRRENFGAPFESICLAIRALAARFPHVRFVYPVHLNPHVREPVERLLGARGGALHNVHLIDPVGYLPFVALMHRATLVLTDSGGIQEEAPSLGKPVLVMRDTTERPEGVAAGCVKLVGTSMAGIVDETARLLTDRAAYERMARVANPYGDGHAAGRIAGACIAHLGLDHRSPIAESPRMTAHGARSLLH